MFDAHYFSALARLVTAILLGLVIGLERAERGREAGMRTHIMVCIGAALVMLIGEHVAEQYSFDITRMGAQVISGIGFLGVGCIITTGDKVKGLTTAAGLWTTACVGLAVGAGYYDVAVTTVALMMAVLYALKPIVDRMQTKFTTVTMFAKVKNKKSLDIVLESFSHLDIKIKSIKTDDGGKWIKVLFETRQFKNSDMNELILSVLETEGVLEVRPIGM